MYASTAGKKIAFECLLFPSQICFGPIGEDSGRTPADIVERQKNETRAWFFFTSVTDNVCQKRFFVPSVIGKIHSFTSLDVAAGGREFFSVRNRERVQKTNFFPSVTDNACKKRIFHVNVCENPAFREPAWTSVIEEQKFARSTAAFRHRVFRVAVVCYLRRPLPDQFFYGSRKLRMRFFVPP